MVIEQSFLSFHYKNWIKKIKNTTINIQKLNDKLIICQIIIWEMEIKSRII